MLFLKFKNTFLYNFMLISDVILVETHTALSRECVKYSLCANSIVLQ